LLIPRKEKSAGKFSLPYINSRFIYPAIIIGAIIILAVFAKGYFSEITEMKLNDNDKRKIVYSVISDAKGDFRDNYLLTSNELNIIKKKINDKAVSDNFTQVVEHNNKVINSVIDSATYSDITEGPVYKSIYQATNDTIQLIGPPKPSNVRTTVIDIISNQLYSFDVNTINKIDATLKSRDSALLSKFNNQLYTYKVFDRNSGMLPDSNFANALSKKIKTINVGDIRAASESKLESKTTLNVSTVIFWIICILLAVFALLKQWSLIPLLGLTTCLYLLTGMTKANWIWFGSWLLLGLIFYLLYGYKKSKLAATK
jgi:hypothetical protein